MPPDQNSPLITPENSARSRKIALLLGGVACAVLVGVIGVALMNRNAGDEQQVSEENQPTPMVSGLTPDQMKQRDEMLARLDALAKEEGGATVSSSEETQARLDSILQNGATTTTEADEAQMRLDALATELVD